ncbi:M48 family metalloprotease [Microtetraspora malaysiensis]|uniref:Peptidase M48 domain-containing protein n=1 Tax=Microtetraspora malaysiensis TaxID=161358 RepID=A0ABW6T3X7_9ACTN
MASPTATSEANAGFVRRDDHRTFIRLRGRRPGRPDPGITRALTYLMSAAVHAITAAIMAAAIVVVVIWHDKVLGWLFGAGLAAVALWSRPRAVRPPDGAEEVSRAEAPTLFEVADRVAHAAGVAPPATVYLHDRLFACAHLRVGVRRRPALVIGLPLLLTLTPRERAGMLAVAFSEDVGGDPARGLLVRSALLTAGEWRHALLSARVERHRPTGDAVIDNVWFPGERIGSQLIGKITGAVLGWPLFLAEFALTRLLAGQSQVARYYADQVAARAVSTPAVLRYLDALTMADGRLTPILSAARRGASIDEIRRAVPLSGDVDREAVIARREASSARRTWRDLAPPLALRAALLEEGDAQEGSTGIDEAESDRIDAELSHHLARTVRTLSQSSP